MGLFGTGPAPDLNALRDKARELKGGMTEERKGQIALAILTAEFQRGGVSPRRAKEMVEKDFVGLNVPRAELVEFLEGLVRQNLDQTFADLKNPPTSAQ
jgi:hypothetical protein